VATGFPGAKGTDEAADMVTRYEQLIAEENASSEPRAADIAAPGSEAQVPYWIRKLRDMNESQGSDPGFCDVVTEWTGWNGEKREPNAAQHLVALGWLALPEVIAHLDDLRPTRCQRWGRSYDPSSYGILRVADVCQQIFEEITLTALYEKSGLYGYVVKDGLVAPAVENARKWWEAHAKDQPVDYYKRILAAGEPGARSKAARWLLAHVDSAMPLVLDAVARGDSETRDQLLRLLDDRLGPEHEKLLESLLTEKDLRVVEFVAWRLWDRCHSDVGAREAARRLETWTPKQDTFGCNFVENTAALLVNVRSDFAVETLCRLLNAKETKVKHEVLGRLDWVPDPRVVGALSAELDDRAASGWSGRNNVPVRFCDQAGESAVRSRRQEHGLRDDTAQRERPAARGADGVARGEPGQARLREHAPARRRASPEPLTDRCASHALRALPAVASDPARSGFGLFHTEDLHGPSSARLFARPRRHRRRSRERAARTRRGPADRR
jgi:hypothetical protein